MKRKYFFGILNINFLLKTGKLKELIKVLNEYKIQLITLQETRYTDEEIIESEGYRILKGKKGCNPMVKGIPLLRTGFIVNRAAVNSITAEFHSPSERLSLLTLQCANKSCEFIHRRAPIYKDMKRNPEKVESFWKSFEH